jgi:hypothetical protein
MKPQDILFIIILLAMLLLARRNLKSGSGWYPAKWFVVAGLICLVASMPLFHLWIFFTAQKFVEYAFYFLLVGIILFFFEKKGK